MKIALIGCPGSGKGTQAKFISQKYHIPIISVGNIVREEIKTKSTLGEKIKKIVESGNLVSDDLIIDLVMKKIALCKNGFILDGFPRTITQVKALEAQKILLNLIIKIDVPDHEVINRLSNRWEHQASGRIYNEKYNPPKISEKDDITGEKLIQRADDQPTIVSERLKIYKEKTKSIITYYKNKNPMKNKNQKQLRFLTINGVGKMQTIQKRIMQQINTIYHHI